jgi:DNA modification methylase
MSESRNNNPHRRIEDVSISLIKCSPNNPRTHDQKQIAKLRQGIQKFGFIGVVLIDEASTLLCGHARVEAARDLGMVSIPAIKITHLTEAEKRAFVIADNRLAELAKWDQATLRQELKFLLEFDVDFDFSALGFDTPQIDALLDEQELEQDEISGALDVARGQLPVSKSGDLWKLADHAVLCGDALQAPSYEELLAGRQAQMVFAECPYNVPIEGHVSTAANKHREFAMAAGEMTPEAFTVFLTTAFALIAGHIVDGAIIFACMDWRHGLEIMQAGKLFTLKNVCVWVKNNGGMGSLYRSQHEFVYVFKSGTAPHINNVELGKHGRNRTNVWDFRGINSFGRKRDELLKLHPTVKPVALVADAIKDCSRRGDLILDPFAGSGTTLIAAEKTNRRAALVEIDPIYVDVILRRWQKLTGRPAICVQDGQTFADHEAGARSALARPSTVGPINEASAQEPRS